MKHDPTAGEILDLAKQALDENPQRPWRTIAGHAFDKQWTEFSDQCIAAERKIRKFNRIAFGILRWRYRLDRLIVRLQRLVG